MATMLESAYAASAPATPIADRVGLVGLAVIQPPESMPRSMLQRFGRWCCSLLDPSRMCSHTGTVTRRSGNRTSSVVHRMTGRAAAVVCIAVIVFTVMTPGASHLVSGVLVALAPSFGIVLSAAVVAADDFGLPAAPLSCVR